MRSVCFVDFSLVVPCKTQFVDIYDDKMTTTNMIPTDKLTMSGNYQYLNENQDGDNEEKIVQEFAHLLEKSKQLFNGLR